MPRTFFASALLLVSGCGPGAPAGPVSYGEPDLDMAESCARTRVWDARTDGWAMRSLQTQAVAPGETWTQPITVYEGVEYRIFACAEDHARDIELLLYTAEGKVAQRDETTGPQADLIVGPGGDRFLVVHGRDLPAPVGVAVAITYR